MSTYLLQIDCIRFQVLECEQTSPIPALERDIRRQSKRVVAEHLASSQK